MSEYQYYEFQTAGRRLSEKEIWELRSDSSRAHLSRWRAGDQATEAILMIMQVKPVSGRGEKAAFSYQLQVLLNGTQPTIWRRLQVPGTANLGWLHAVLQVAMGWTNSHLHQFICGEHMYADPSAQLEQYEGDPPVLDESKFTLAELLKDIHQGLVYEYDFGDSWEHIVTVEKILPAGCLNVGDCRLPGGLTRLPAGRLRGNRGLRGIAQSAQEQEAS